MTKNLTEQAVDLLREVMEHEGLSALALSQRCDVDQTTISRILRGKAPAMNTYEKIMDGLGLSVRIEIDVK